MEGKLRCTLDGSIENLGREVVCAYITTYRDGVTTSNLYFVDNRLGLLLVETRFVKLVATRARGQRFYVYLLADDNLCALLSKKDGRASTDTL